MAYRTHFKAFSNWIFDNISFTPVNFFGFENVDDTFQQFSGLKPDGLPHRRACGFRFGDPRAPGGPGEKDGGRKTPGA
jgi:hypothetical protein